MDFEFGYEYSLMHPENYYFVGKMGSNPLQLEGVYSFPDKEDIKDSLLISDIIDWEMDGLRDLYEHERRNAARIHKWMNKDQVECYLMLCDLMYGAHHVFGKITNGGRNDGLIICMHHNDVATYDYNLLTRAVVLAHDRCIRFSIMPASGDMLRFGFHKRNRAGEMNQRHPTIEDHIEIIRNGQ